MRALQKQLDDDQRDTIYRIASAYYQGRYSSITAAAEADSNISAATWFRWKHDCPTDFQIVFNRARADVIREREDTELAFTGATLASSIILQERTREILTNTLGELEHIITTRYEAIETDARNEAGEREIRHIVHYPRDRLGAMRLLWEIAREGVIPEATSMAKRLEIPQEEPDARLPLPANLPSNFQSAILTTKDGNTIEYHAKPAFEIVEADTDVQDM